MNLFAILSTCARAVVQVCLPSVNNLVATALITRPCSRGRSSVTSLQALHTTRLNVATSRDCCCSCKRSAGLSFEASLTHASLDVSMATESTTSLPLLSGVTLFGVIVLRTPELTASTADARHTANSHSTPVSAGNCWHSRDKGVSGVWPPSSSAVAERLATT